MDINNFTQKSQEAVLKARESAGEHDHQYVHPEHLLEGLLALQDGIIYPILAKVGAHVTDVRGPLQSALDAMPTVYGGSEVAFAKDAIDVLNDAEREKTVLRDSYVSIEHILIALAISQSAVGDDLRGLGVLQAVLPHVDGWVGGLVARLHAAGGMGRFDAAQPSPRPRRCPAHNNHLPQRIKLPARRYEY